MKMTKESLLKIISAADEVISALAGTNNEVHKDDNDKMIRLWDDLNDRYAPPEVVRELARMALAAMDSEPVTVPEQITYISEPTIQNILASDDSSPMANAARLLAYEVRFWRSVPLFRHAQSAPVAPEEMNFSAACNFVQVNGMAKEDRVTLAMRAWNACRAAMLAAAQPAPTIQVTDAMAYAFHHALTDGPLGDEDVEDIKAGLQAAFSNVTATQPALVVQDGYVMVPMRLTAENGAKVALSGEFSETKFVNCPECFGDDECETCDGSGRIEITVPVTWTTIKEIWAKGVEHFAADSTEE